MNFLDVKTDYAFKKVFGSETSKEILISFLNALVYDNKSKPEKANNQQDNFNHLGKVLSKFYEFCTKDSKISNNGVKNMQKLILQPDQVFLDSKMLSFL